MDLVDIDQVLDNLELREAADEHNRTVLQAQNALEARADKAGTLSAASHKSSFVGVSQVFNSLDDYQKNVESLESAPAQRYDEECRLISKNEDLITAYDDTNVSTTIKTEQTPIKATNNNFKKVVNPFEGSIDSHIPLRNKQQAYNGDVPVDVDEEEVSADLHKFTENNRHARRIGYELNDTADNSLLSTSDSLTTSSSSTFSSGPSPGIISTTDEHSAAITPEDYEYVSEDRNALLPRHPSAKDSTDDDEDGDSDCEEQPCAITSTGAESKIEENDAVSTPQVESTGGIEDIAVGLSSISLTTAGNSQLNLPTASSVLQNVLEDLSETTGNSLLSREINNGHLKNTSPEMLQPNTDLKKIETEEDTREKEIPIKASDKVVPPLQAQHIKVFQQPITFGSTMDEISDTELDSMLQEMDIDDGSEVDVLPRVNIANTRISPPPPPIGEKTIDNVDRAEPMPANANPYEEAITTQLEHKASLGGNDTDVQEISIGCEIGSDNLNADNFSQASTVEFSEIRAHSTEVVHAVDTDMLAISNSVASSLTGSECSLEVGVVGGGAVNVNGEEHGTTAQLVNKDRRKDSPENADDEEEGSTDEGAFCGDESARRPQRPTSLNLPTLQPSLYENAGQTPPGTTLTQNKTLQIEALAAANAEVGNKTAPTGDASSEVAEASGYSDPYANLGKVPPIWVPDNMAVGCMQCQAKFTMIKRRHHCRACGKVLCSVCCSQKFKLEFLSNAGEVRVCLQCYLILTQRQQQQEGCSLGGNEIVVVSGESDAGTNSATNSTTTDSGQVLRSPNPNNPMEYCSTIPPYRQVNTQNFQPPSVIVPVGVLKKEGSSYSSNSSNGGENGVDGNKKTRKRKSVMFSDGIAPGSELASIEHQWADAKHARRGAHQLGDKSSRNNNSAGANKPPTPVGSGSNNSDSTAMGLVAALFRGSIPPLAAAATVTAAQEGSEDSTKTAKNKLKNSTKQKSDGETVSRTKRVPSSGADENGCFIPVGGNNALPPLYVRKGESNCDFDYQDVKNNQELVTRLQSETLRFALEKNFFVDVKILNLKCCMNRTVINFTTCGMHHVGNDELIILLEFEPSSVTPANAVNNDISSSAITFIPKDIFIHLYEIYRDAELGTPIAELSYTSPRVENFLGSSNYGGFIFIRATFQCLQDVLVPEQPFLIGILIHHYEVPWAKVFPLRLMLRLGAQYRYYPCPHISIPNRDPVYGEIAQTIINFLADFRNYSYTLPSIKGMYIHMEDRQTTVMIPRNRHEDVVKAIKNASDHILAFGGNFSKTADGHLVCMQNVNDSSTELYAYSTQAINIQGHPRKVTGTSFFVLNESLKTSSGLSGKCSIVEDGLMVQILPSKMEEIKKSLQNRKDVEILCGPLDADDKQTEVVSIKWVDNDRDFNVGVKSTIDEKSMEGVSSMRVHDSFNYSNANYSIRLTDIYIIKYDEWYASAQSELVATSTDITRMAGQIARSACVALLPFLDLLVASGSQKLALRATLHQENVCYEAGACGNKLAPLYMNALDNQLIPTLHGESSGIEEAIILELVFYILNV
ncbi:zinc finger FYVE domain-containing protein 16 [Eurosta solidaginis]|uniref:zinc finger FYVE domain-containing protein 16 n=1 Tax=Eurosta solidaginis TaxID=178769 RepID=UPI0035311FBD